MVSFSSIVPSEYWTLSITFVTVFPFFVSVIVRVDVDTLYLYPDLFPTFPPKFWFGTPQFSFMFENGLEKPCWPWNPQSDLKPSNCLGLKPPNWWTCLTFLCGRIFFFGLCLISGASSSWFLSMRGRSVEVKFITVLILSPFNFEWIPMYLYSVEKIFFLWPLLGTPSSIIKPKTVFKAWFLPSTSKSLPMFSAHAPLVI